ncbi:MAG: inorganic phosphate transporter [Chloroflexi bacterium]|nr:inorganic phosphate transporter [Chloroflexota bacterium]
MDPIILLVSLVAIALVFDFLNGFHDSANVVATMISSGALPPWGALVVASLAEFAGPFLFGVAVAATIGKDIVTPETVTISVVFAALGSAITWNLVTWYFGIPSSSSHALIGGVAGAVVAGYGLSHIHFDGITKIFLALFLSPPLGMAAGYLFMRSVVFLARGASPGVNQFFKRSQILTSVALALSHGSNDAQKTMGIITMSLVTLRFEEAFVVPVWVIVACAGAIALGVATGGWRIIKTLGGKMYKVRPVHGFTAQAASAAVILGGALLGGPVSTTQVVSSAIMGVGSAERLSKVRWEVAYSIVMAWAVTIPASAAVAALLYFAIASFLG